MMVERSRIEPVGKWRGIALGILEMLGLRKKQVAQPTGKTIKVGPRDTLRSLARREYGDETQWLKIYEANKWRIDGDEVVPGQDVFIPDVPSESNE